MNEEISNVEVARQEESELASPCLCDGPVEMEEIFPVEADSDADAISDARFYLVAMGAFLFGFSGKRPMIDRDEA
jgi:hypothetical protein